MTTLQATRERVSRGWKGRPSLLLLVRRAHLYLGLLMWPFVLLFAITGLSFNHPALTRGLRVLRVSPAETARHGVPTWQPEKLARDLVQRLNADGGANYSLSSRRPPRFSGWPLFAAPTQAGKQVVVLNLADGGATITERKPPPATRTPEFEGRNVTLPRYDLQPIAQSLTQLLRAQQLPLRGEVRVHPEVHPQLRFVVRDQQQREWNATYDLASGKLGGQLSESSHDEAVIELFESIHKQHHYPPHTDATSFWALFADLTALTLIVWAGTGIAMWWQMRKLRRSGALIIALAIGISTLILASTARELRSAPAEEH